MSTPKSYAEIVEIFKKIGINDPEKLSDADIESFAKKYAGGELSDNDIEMFCEVRKKNKTHEQIPVPDLPENQPLTKQDFQDLPNLDVDSRLSLIQGDIDEVGRQPIDFSTMTAADWMRVIVDCNMIYARIFKNLGSGLSDLPTEPMFFPPNKSLFGTQDFKVSQHSLLYRQKSELAEHFDEKAVMTNITAGGSFSTPWVSGGAEYSHATQNRTAEVGSKVTSVFKVESPVGEFTLPSPSELAESQMKINDNFGNFVKDYIEQHEDCTKEEVVKEMTRRFGDVVPRRATIGVACYTTQTTSIEETQSLESVSDSFKSSVTSKFACFGASANAGGGSSESGETGDESQENSYAFAAIAGNLPDPSNPMSIGNYRSIPSSWRIIHLGDELTPVYDYLSGDAKDKLNSLGGADTLFQNEYIDPGKKKISMNGKYEVFMREDGNLQILGPNGEVRWETASSCAPNELKGATIDLNGVLFVNDIHFAPVWSCPDKWGALFMVIEDDGYWRGYKNGEVVYQFPEN
ncbi:uncharacterized protein [Clytia hemisphaerica]|uniref:Bulb-type lectin domain-containing protein n=1 Tax=Clytia hemisphaerica TaxID=252671 RepID=A0A7M5WRB9_9CNID|eukprot:TCONS_00019637-protein